MGYFDKETRVDSLENLYKQISNICLDHLMLSSDAYVCSIKHCLHGYKKLHRCLSKEFQDIYLDIQKEAIEKFDKYLEVESNFRNFRPQDFKEHLELWNEILERDLKTIGSIIVQMFNNCGYISCNASKIQKLLYKSLIKNEQAIKKLESLDWSQEAIYEHDNMVHDKMVKKGE